MAKVRPFKAIRPAKAYADQVASLPYDVMNRAEAKRMAEGKPYSFLNICRAEITLPDQPDPYAQSVYQKAKANMDEMLNHGILIREEKPMLYIYKQIMHGRAQTGVVGCVAIDEYLDNTIKKHELTRVEKEIDRINHFDVCNANTEPVFLTYREDKRLSAMIEGFMAHNDPSYDFISEDGIQHIFWPIEDDSVAEGIVHLFDQIPNLYIADGHHRSASACKVGQKRRSENPGYTGNEEFNFFMAVIFPDKDLRIFDYNRAVSDLNGNSKESFLDKVKAVGFEVEEKGSAIYAPETKHTFGMFLDGMWYRIAAKPEIISGDIIESLDVSILQNKLLEPILGIKDPRTDKRIDFIGGIRGLEELERRVNLDMKVAFAVYPVEISDLLAVSDNDMIMPPKSTWFEPKLASGLFIHEL